MLLTVLTAINCLIPAANKPFCAVGQKRLLAPPYTQHDGKALSNTALGAHRSLIGLKYKSSSAVCDTISGMANGMPAVRLTSSARCAALSICLGSSCRAEHLGFTGSMWAGAAALRCAPAQTMFLI